MPKLIEIILASLISVLLSIYLPQWIKKVPPEPQKQGYKARFYPNGTAESSILKSIKNKVFIN